MLKHVEICIGGDCADNCLFEFWVGDDPNHGCESINVDDNGRITVMLPKGEGPQNYKVFRGLPYQARVADV